MTGPPDNFSHPAALPARPPRSRGQAATIGEALAQARLDAGLSVAQVSQKTRIREAIIRDIERDDYSSCGGDFYARGHIRAIARAAGADSEPLIRQYDAIRSGAGQVAPAEQVTPADEFGPDGYAAPEEFGPDGFAASGGYGAPEGFGPGGFPPQEDAGPDGYAAPEGFETGGFPPQEDAGPDGYAAPEGFETGGFAAPEEFGPGGFPAPDYLGSGGFAQSDEDEFAASGEPADPGEPEAPEEVTSPNQVVTTSQMAAFDDIMASRPPAPERTAPGVTRPGVREAGVTGPRVTGPGFTEPRVAGPPITGRGSAAPGDAALDATAPPRSHRAGTDGTGRPGRPDRIAVIAAVVALAIFGGLAFLLIPGSRSAPQAGAAATGPASHGRAKPGGRHPATGSPAAPARGARPALLTPVRAVAFGRGGPAHGDNPQDASLAIDGRPRTSWETDWYTTSHFGNLKTGTGLLLDMGHRVTITSARITLGRIPGADLQLRAGDSAALAGLRPVAHAVNAHGLVRLQLARPAQARYVLIWFTQLPPDPAGTYQARVYNVRLR